MEQHIQFMSAFLSGLRSLPNPDGYTQAYIRAFEVCLHSAKRNQERNKIEEAPYEEYVELQANA